MTERPYLSLPVRHVARIAGDYCEHQSLGYTCQHCMDLVSDVLRAAETAGFAVVQRPVPNESLPVAGGSAEADSS
jgi:hypothetical protein